MDGAKTTAIGFLILVILVASIPPLQAAVVEYDLTIAEEEINITGNPAHGMTINRGIPGPTLRFREGDDAFIRVHNRMAVDTSIHWHGILVPPDMDGVPYVSFPPIQPGATFTYRFPIRQAGTYWYHSHTRLQEQSGVYGSIVIEPREPRQKLISPASDHVILFSDWTDEKPHEVLRTLKRGSEWYALEKGAGQSILGALRLGMLGDYMKRELQRMPAMDISDVAYDRFLANGAPEMALPAKPHDTVRLRIIDGSSTTFFFLEFAGGPLTVVSADGQDVEPVEVKRLLIGVAETYDVLVHVPASGAYEFRATAHDGSGFASVWLGSGARHPAPEIPRPNLYHTMGDLKLNQIFAFTPAGAMGMSDREVEAGKFDRPGMMGMGPMHMHEMPGKQGMDHGAHAPGMTMGGMEHGTHAREPGKPGIPPEDQERARRGKKYGLDFRPLAADVSSSKNLAVDGMDSRRPWPPYDKLRAVRPTAFARGKPVREVRLTLDGDMERYVWFINNKPLSESDVVRIRAGEVVRFIMINRTMMHHPMHLHGHFFRVINGQGDYSPLKHTVDVAPMSTTVIEFEASEVGDWFFHCHLLYHMKSGMARVVHYEDFTLTPQLAAVRPRLYRENWYFFGRANALSNMSTGLLVFSNTRNILSVDWEVGWQKVDQTEWETILTWDSSINRFLTIFAGADLEGAGDVLETSRGVFGIRYVLPLNIEFRAWVDTDGGGRFNLGKVLELTPRLGLFGETQYDTHERWEHRAGLAYTVHKSFSLVGQWHSDYGWGGGLQIRF